MRDCVLPLAYDEALWLERTLRDLPASAGPWVTQAEAAENVRLREELVRRLEMPRSAITAHMTPDESPNCGPAAHEADRLVGGGLGCHQRPGVVGSESMGVGNQFPAAACDLEDRSDFQRQGPALMGLTTSQLATIADELLGIGKSPLQVKVVSHVVLVVCSKCNEQRRVEPLPDVEEIRKRFRAFQVQHMHSMPPCDADIDFADDDYD